MTHHQSYLRRLQILEKVQAGIDLADIAREFNLDQRYVRQIIKSGSAGEEPCLVTSISAQKRSYEQVDALFAEGLHARQIAERLDLKKTTVAAYLSRLRGSSRQLANDRSYTLTDRDAQIIEMCKDPEMRLKDIGLKFGFTRERARQIIQRLVAMGSITRTPFERRRDDFRSVAELRNRTIFVDRMIADGVITPTKSGLITPEQYEEALRYHQCLMPKCISCGIILRMIKSKFCTACASIPESQRARHKEQWGRLRDGLTKHNQPLQKAIVERLKRSDASKCGIGFAEAIRITGLSKMQMDYLRYGNLLTIRPQDPNKPKGKGCKFLYSKAEMEQIAEFRKELA